MQIDLNCDLGESFGRYTLGMDEKIIPMISSANIACGFHASDPVIMEKTVKMASEHEIGIGAHPGFHDLVGFGRRNMNLPQEEVKAILLYQIGALHAFCKASHTKLQHVKPHGALYNMAAKDKALSDAVAEALFEVNPDIILLGLSGSQMIRSAREKGLSTAQEVFADRAYEEDGSLVARTKAGAMITDEDEAVARVIRMIKEHKVKSITGKDITIKPDSVCVHGDGEKSLLFVQKLIQAFRTEQIQIRPLREIVQ